MPTHPISSMKMKKSAYPLTPAYSRYHRGSDQIMRPDNNEKDCVIGFSAKKMFDSKSIFFGIPSINAISTYFEFFVDNIGLIPNKGDTRLIAIGKLAAFIWTGVRAMNFRPDILKRDNLEEIDFGSSTQIMYDLINATKDPDEVFRPVRFSTLMPHFLYRYPIKDGNVFFVVHRDSGNVQKIMISKNITKEDILDEVWNGLRNVIKLEVDEELKYVAEDIANKKIFGSSNKLIQKLISDYEFFRKNNISRGYLLIGKPGTGKTGIINSIVNSVNGRVFVISGMERSIDELESLFINMRPDFIIFDDCDRSGSDPAFVRLILKMIENVKDKNPHTNFLFTANTFSGILSDDAVTRKGRIDQIYEVPVPDKSDRKEIFTKYSKEIGIDLSPEDLKKCIDSSDGLTGADIKELCIQLQRASITEVFDMEKEIGVLKEKYAAQESSFKNNLYTVRRG